MWLKNNYGKANKCENPECKHKSKHFDWSLIHGKIYDYNRKNFWQLCKSCHILYDFTEETRKKFKERMAGKGVTKLKPIKCAKCGVEIAKAHSSQKLCKKCSDDTRKIQRENWVKSNNKRVREIKLNWYYRNRIAKKPRKKYEQKP